MGVEKGLIAGASDPLYRKETVSCDRVDHLVAESFEVMLVCVRGIGVAEALLAQDVDLLLRDRSLDRSIRSIVHFI
jgi:hypothetical protein